MSARLTESTSAYRAGDGITPESPYPAHFTEELCVTACLDACGFKKTVHEMMTEISAPEIPELMGVPADQRWAYAVLVQGAPPIPVEVYGYQRTNGICVPVVVRAQGRVVPPVAPPVVGGFHRWAAGAVAVVTGLVSVLR